MAKKKAIDDQVESGDSLTIAEVKQFIEESRKKRANFILIADRSWREIKKRNDRDKLYGGNNLDISRRWAKFPLWWSAWQIRRPLTLARLAIPVIKDTQGDDPIGRTACVIGERFTRNILKTFDGFDQFSACNDDFLITNFGWGRWYYRVETSMEDEKVRLQLVAPPMPEPIEGQPPPEPQPPIVVDRDGFPVDDYLTDEEGPYQLTGEKIAVENEEVYFEHGLYSCLYVDPYATRWSKVERIAYEYPYSYRQFISKFGKAALDKIAVTDHEDHRTGKKPIVVFEYHDKSLREVRWFAENSEDFFQPSSISPSVQAAGVGTDELKEVSEKAPLDNSDLYGLSGFFPCTPPLLINQPTDEFWPIPEYFQMVDIIEDVHSIVSRLILLTKAIRVRFLFDKAVPELKTLISETGEAGGLGVTNLAQALMNGKGDLRMLVAYFPVAEMIQGLENMYKAFSQRMDMFYQASGLNDILRGQASDVEKTFGERQMEGKFALNRIEPIQRKVQEWLKDNYQLGMELGLKMFTDETIDQYVTPQTLDPEDKERYVPALELLKSNKRRRFRVDFETDSTIAINEQWRKAQAIELANVLTKAMEATAKTAETQPELAGAELQVLKHLIGEFSDGKLFIDEIQDAIEQVIAKVQNPEKPDFNPDAAKFQLEQQKLQFEVEKAAKDDQFRAGELQLKNAEITAQNQLDQLRLQAESELEVAKLQSSERITAIESQVAQFKMQIESQTASAEMQVQMQKLATDLQLAREELELKRQELIVELKKIADKKEVDEFAAMIDARVAVFNEKLLSSEHQLEQMRIMLDEKEKYATEARLQQEHELDKLQAVMDIALKKKELDAPTESSGEEKPKKKGKRKSKIIRDENDRISEIVHED